MGTTTMKTATSTENHDAHGEHEGTEAGHGHEPDRINAVYVGLIDRTNVLGLQRAVNDTPLRRAERRPPGRRAGRTLGNHRDS